MPMESDIYLIPGIALIWLPVDAGKAPILADAGLTPGNMLLFIMSIPMTPCVNGHCMFMRNGQHIIGIAFIEAGITPDGFGMLGNICAGDTSG